VIAEDFRPEEMVAELATRWEIARNYFKRHACCRYNHATLDALRTIIDRAGPVAPADVEAVEVETYSLAAQLDDPAPHNMLAAKFSVPFAVATFIAHKAATVEAFREDARADAVVRALAQRVQVREDEALTAMVPAQRPSRVRLRLTDGRVEEAETFTNRGDTEDPYSADELTAKFHELATPVWGADATQRLLETCMTSDRLADITALTAQLGAA
jgi:2-methylcitrate dehydratase PrpD